MNLETMTAIDAGLDAAGNLLRVSLLLVLALWAYNYEFHEQEVAKQVYKFYANMSSDVTNGNQNSSSS